MSFNDPVRAEYRPPAGPELVNVRLGVMMFLEFFIWGSWYVSTGPYMATSGPQMVARIGDAYSVGPLARLVPTDLAVGWGPMSDSGVLEAIEISQGNRVYYWRPEPWPVAREVIESHSANWHLIPENELVGRALARLRAGSVVELRGKLVEIEGKEGGMRTALSRTDTGAGACEILLAQSLELVDAG